MDRLDISIGIPSPIDFEKGYYSMTLLPDGRGIVFTYPVISNQEKNDRARDQPRVTQRQYEAIWQESFINPGIELKRRIYRTEALEFNNDHFNQGATGLNLIPHLIRYVSRTNGGHRVSQFQVKCHVVITGTEKTATRANQNAHVDQVDDVLAEDMENVALSDDQDDDEDDDGMND